MKYPRYPAYRPSGIDWLGEIPAHWDVGVLGFCATVKARLGWKGLKADEYVSDGYVFLSTPNLKDTEIDFVNVNYITQERYEESPEIKLSPGDVLVAKDGSTLGTANVVRVLPTPATVNSSIAVIRPKDGVDSVFLYYFFCSDFTQNTIQRLKGGMGVPHLFQSDLRKFRLLLPPLDEQIAIAAFLDRETAQIDTLIARQERLIALLQEKRQALISHAVTRGLDPAAPMKESGVAWLGQVPAHWEVVQLRRVLVAIEQGQTLSSDNRLAEADEWAVLKSGCVNRGIFRADEHKALAVKDGFDRQNQVQVGDLLMSRASGSIELVGSVALVRKTRSKLLLSDKTFRLVPAQDVDREFLALQLNASHVRAQIEQTSNGAEGLPNNITKPAINALWVALPPEAEQVSLVLSLSHLFSKIDAMLERLVRSVALLQERRTALISAAVTGKIDALEHL